jgi:hypothetical protein
VAAHARSYGGLTELVLETLAQPGTPLRSDLLGLVDELLANAEAPTLPIRLRVRGTQPSLACSTIAS